MNREKIVKLMNRTCIYLFLILIACSIYIMINDIGLIDGLNFGPGSYYYSDIPGWENIFYTEDFISPNTNYPFLFLILFVGWGILSWKALVLLDRKLK